MSVFEPLPDLLDVYQAIPGPMLFGVALAAMAPVIFGTWAHLRHWWLNKRLERRLARDGYMLVEEHRDHLFAIGDEPAPIDWSAIALNALINVLLVGAAGMMFALGREWEWEIALLGAGILGMLFGLWRRMNAPEPDPFGPPEATIPPKPYTALPAQSRSWVRWWPRSSSWFDCLWLSPPYRPRPFWRARQRA